jgi:hypothetical protein
VGRAIRTSPTQTATAESAARFCSAQKNGKIIRAEGPAVHPAKGEALVLSVAPRILLCLAVFGPTGQEFACLTNGTRGIGDELLARWAGHYREQKAILAGLLYQGFALRWVN